MLVLLLIVVVGRRRVMEGLVLVVGVEMLVVVDRGRMICLGMFGDRMEGWRG